MTTTKHTIREEKRKFTARELAARTGLSERTVRRVIAEERDVYVGRAQERRAQIVELYRHGLTHAQIAERLTVTRPLVSRRIAEARRDGIDVSRYSATAASDETPPSLSD